MAVFYRLHQDQSTGTKRSGKWYARAVPTAVIGTRQLAEIIQRNCTVKRSDVMAVLIELGETCTQRIEKRAGSIATSDSFSICFLLVCFTLS